MFITAALVLRAAIGSCAKWEHPPCPSMLPCSSHWAAERFRFHRFARLFVLAIQGFYREVTFILVHIACILLSTEIIA